MKTRAEEVLKEAIDMVSIDRDLGYGDPKDNLTRVAKLWRAYLETNNGVITRPIDAYDVACMMVLFKLAHMRNKPESTGAVMEVAGYAACAAEILENNK